MATLGRGRVPRADMGPETVIEVLDAFQAAGVRTWLIGGWAIDALVGVQRRPHDDLDLLVTEPDAGRASALLAGLGYPGHVAAPGSTYMVDAAGRQVDVHVIAVRPDGSAVYRMDNGSPWVYAAGSLEGRGTVLGRPVACVTPEQMMLEHTIGYALDAVHQADVVALAAAFGLSVPPFDRA